MAQLKYNGIINRGYGEQVKYNAQELSEMQKKINSLPQAGIGVQLTGTTSGTITDEQLETLQLNDLNYIILNGNEIFELADNQVESGFMIYSHTGYTAGKTQIKILSITTSTKSFTVVTNEMGGGGVELYKSSFQSAIDGDPKNTPVSVTFIYFKQETGSIFILDVILELLIGSTYQSYYVHGTVGTVSVTPGLTHWTLAVPNGPLNTGKYDLANGTGYFEVTIGSYPNIEIAVPVPEMLEIGEKL